MLHHISGKVTHITDSSVVVSAGSYGFEIGVPQTSSLKLNQECTLYMYMHWNQDQGPSWYGFESQQERDIFMLIISCSGIGPRIGLAILSDIGVAQFIDAIQSGDDRILSKVNGIGAKKAEQIVVQLKHKVSNLLKSGKVQVSAQSTASDWHTISQALEALNYSRGEISQAVTHLRSLETKDQMSFDQLMRKALSFLSKQQ